MPAQIAQDSRKDGRPRPSTTSPLNANRKPMRAAVIFGLGTSPDDLKPFQDGSPTKWSQGLPASSAGQDSAADAILIFGGDGTIHRHLPALVRLQLPLLVVPAGSGNDFARALKLRSIKDSLRAWRDFVSGKIQARPIDLGVIVPSAAPERKHYFCCVAGCGLDLRRHSPRQSDAALAAWSRRLRPGNLAAASETSGLLDASDPGQWRRSR